MVMVMVIISPKNATNAKKRIKVTFRVCHPRPLLVSHLYNHVPEEVVLHGKRHCLPSNLQWEALGNHEPSDGPEPNLIPSNIHEHGHEGDDLICSEIFVAAGVVLAVGLVVPK